MMTLTFLFLVTSIVWLWVGIRSNGNELAFSHDHTIDETIKMQTKSEFRSRIIPTIALIFIGFYAYLKNDNSPTIVYILIIWWLLFYLINSEISKIYKRIERMDNELQNVRRITWHLRPTPPTPNEIALIKKEIEGIFI